MFIIAALHLSQKSPMSQKRRRIIGLTGGIGTGKTTVSNYLAQAYQLPILDADIYAREAVQPNSPVLEKIRQRYGANILLDDGSLNRRALGDIVFNNSQEKSWLEAQIHPYVRQRFQTQLDKIQANTVVFVIPLLFEAGLTNIVTEIWVVTCPESQQLERICQRDKLTTQQAQARIQSQIPLAQKVAAADVVLDNSSTEEGLKVQVDREMGN